MLGKIQNLLGKKKDQTSANTVAQVKTTNDVMPQDVLTSGNIGSLSLSKEEQKKLLEDRKRIPIYVLVLKYIAISGGTIALILFLFMKVDLHPENQYLSVLGKSFNTASENSIEQETKTQLETEILTQNKFIKNLSHKMKDADYGSYTELRKSIESQNRDWYSGERMVKKPLEGADALSINPTDPNTYEEVEENYYGLLDAFDGVIDYFEDPEYRTNYFLTKQRSALNCNTNDKDCIAPIPFELENELSIKNISINQQGASINLEAVEYGNRVFMLAAEITDMINAFPLYSNGHIRTFNRKELRGGDPSIALNLRFNLQQPSDIDSDDNFLPHYKKWQKKNGK